MPEEKKASSEEKKTGIENKEVSRRSLLKWTAGLAAAGVVGIGVGYGVSESGILKTPPPPPPPPPSFKPPLSSEVQSTVDGIVKGLVDRHAGETIKYGGCSCNCSGTGCMFKYHFKNGALVSIEPEDTHYPQTGRTDSMMTQKDLDQALFERRGCPIGWSWVDHVNQPNRVMYPIKRAPGTARGEGQWLRISYDEAINTIASNIKQMKEKYGPFFLLNPYGSTTAGGDLVFAALEAGCMGYGLCTDDVARLTGPFTGIGGQGFSAGPDNDLPDGLKYAKLFILIGRSHFTTHWGGSAFAAGWYMRLAREKGTPVITVDPKYNSDCEVYGDQWVPCKPGTDNAWLMAMAYVIMTEGLYDKAWCDKYMYGWGPQTDYILGKGGKGVSDWDPGDKGREERKNFKLDGWPDKPYVEYDKLPKTPEWAEKICGIPADTIREMARLYAKTKPSRLERHAGATRKSYGEYTLKTVYLLTIMTGNAPGIAGGSIGDGRDRGLRTDSVSYGSMPRAPMPAGQTQYASPTFYRAFHWWKTVPYALKVKRGEPSIMWKDRKMSWQEWGTLVGFNADPAFLSMFDPKMIWGNASNCVVMGENTNAQIRALTDPYVEFSFHQHTRITATGSLTDMILPIIDNTFEDSDFSSAGYGHFDGKQVLPGYMKPPAEARTYHENDLRILEGVGGLPMARYYWSGYNGSATFEQDYEKMKADGYEKNGRAWLKTQNWEAPSWDEIKQADKGHNLTQWHGSWFYPDIDTVHGQEAIGGKIDTVDGKAQMLWDHLANPDGSNITPHQGSKAKGGRYKQQFDFKGRRLAHCPNDWKDLQPIPVYHPCYNGMEGFPAGKLKTYPLFLLTNKSRYAIHYLMGDPGNPRIRDVKRHSLWINATDARTRGIKDHDAVRIWNDQGQVAVRAYVTNRIMPGVALLRTGNRPNYATTNNIRLDINLGPETISGGATNQFTGGDDTSPISPAKVTNTVQVEKFASGQWFRRD